MTVDDSWCVVQVRIIVERNVDQVKRRSREMTDGDDGFILFTETFDHLVDECRLPDIRTTDDKDVFAFAVVLNLFSEFIDATTLFPTNSTGFDPTER